MKASERRGIAAAAAARDDAAEGAGAAERRWNSAADGIKQAGAEALTSAERRLAAATTHTSTRVVDLEEKMVAAAERADRRYARGRAWHLVPTMSSTRVLNPHALSLEGILGRGERHLPGPVIRRALNFEPSLL